MDDIKLTAQSNELTMSKINFSNVYQKRIVYSIVDSLSPHLKNIIETDSKGSEIGYEKGLFSVDKITYRLKDLEKNRQNYPLLKSALIDLQSKNITIEKDDGDEIGTSMVLKYVWKKGAENVELTIDRELFEFLASITKGYTLYQLKTAMSLPSVYAMKIYELIAKWRTKPKFYISIDELRFITNTQKKYKTTGEFKKWVLDPSKKLLDKNTETDLRFNYEHVKKGKKIIGFNFYITKTGESFELKKLRNQISPRWVLPKEVINICEGLGISLKGKALEYIESLFEAYHKNSTKLVEQIRFWEQLAYKKEIEVARYVISCVKNEINSLPEKKD